MNAAYSKLLESAAKLLERTMEADEWDLAGRIDVGEEVKTGTWRVTTPLDDPLRLEHLPTGRKLAIPFREIETDFASIPEIAQRLGSLVKALHLNPRDYEKAALFHDALYDAGSCFAVFGGKAIRVPVSRQQADAMLFICLECLGATIADGLAYHGAVSLFGGRHWNSCRKVKAPWKPLFDEGSDDLVEKEEAAS